MEGFSGTGPSSYACAHTQAIAQHFLTKWHRLPPDAHARRGGSRVVLREAGELDEPVNRMGPSPTARITIPAMLSVLRTRHGILLLLSAGFLLLLPAAALPTTEQKAQPKAQKAQEIPQAPVSDLIQRILTEESRLDAARNLSALAATPEERQLAQKAIRLADHELGLAFLGALHRAAENPLPPTPEARALDAQVKTLENSVDDLQRLVDGLKKKAASSRGRKKEKLLAQVDFQQAKLELAKDELAGAREDLIDAGGDLKSQIERLQADYQVAEQHLASSTTSGAIASSLEPADTLLGHLKLWLALRSTRNQLQAERESALNALEIVRQRLAEAGREVAGESVASAAPSDHAPARAAAVPANQSGTAIIESLRKQSWNQKVIAGSKLRIRDLTELAGTYEKWDALEAARQKNAATSLIFSCLWIALIVLTGIIVQRLLHRLFLRMTEERRRLHTLQTMSRFGVQACCLALILLVVLGPPSQLTTLVAFAGAGLTVALKDFIVSFIGWFMLMGRNGVHVGDWVEINGVCGEVIEVSLFHTVMLETGNWNDPGHPTGRKATFTNSYAIEGHYFNFTSSGQWLWDELEFLVPPGDDPNTLADAVLRMVTAETQATAQVAEQEWQKLVPAQDLKSVSAAPILNLRPTSNGIAGRVRYITRANERFQARTHLYHLIVELLHGRAAQQAAAVARSS